MADAQITYAGIHLNTVLLFSSVLFLYLYYSDAFKVILLDLGQSGLILGMI